MASQKFQVQVWGFPEASLLDWPPDLQPIQTQKLGEELVFVHGSALPLFLRQAQHSPDRLPAAVFCKDRGTETPPDSWEWFDRVIEEGDWEGIRRILKCPRQVEIGEWVEEISGDQLEEITAAFTSEPPEISVLGNTPIPVEIKGILESVRSVVLFLFRHYTSACNGVTDPYVLQLQNWAILSGSVPILG